MLLHSCFPTLPCQVTVGKPSAKCLPIVVWCWLTEHLPQSCEDQGESQRSESRTGGECEIVSGNSMPCSCPQVTSKLEVARWTTVLLGSRKHIYFADVFQVQRGRGGTNRMREVSMGCGGQAQPPPVALSVFSEHRKRFWPRAGSQLCFPAMILSAGPQAVSGLKHAGIILSSLTGGVNKLNVLF